MTLILASASATRIQLLRAAGLDFAVQPAQIDEGRLKDSHQADDAAVALALAKAQDVSRRKPGDLVIGCDQTLLFEGCLIDKSGDLEGARRLLQRLRGGTHRLSSATALVRDGELRWQGVQDVDLTMRRFDDAYLDAYLAAEGEGILSSVGCYRLEGRGIRLFEAVKGDYFAVLGLSLLPLLAALRAEGVPGI
jgi:septum formation protein